MQTGINLQATPASPESVEKLRETIMDILLSGAEQKTLRCALHVLSASIKSEVSQCHISNVSFNDNSTQKR